MQKSFVAELNTRPLLGGMVTSMPVLSRFKPVRGGGNASVGYRYEVWIKHLVLLTRSGYRGGIPRVVAELGPGNSLGLGMAALLSGAERYIGLDVVLHNKDYTEESLSVLRVLVDLLKQRHGVAGDAGWPRYGRFLDEHGFPADILTDRWLDETLHPSRIDAIENAILNPGQQFDGISAEYVAPWMGRDVIARESVDVILSQSVLEHVSDLDATYETCAAWLRPGGWISHQADLTAHGVTKHWNGYWSLPEWTWRLIEGSRPYLINRAPASAHRVAAEAHGFRVSRFEQRYRNDGIERSELAQRWRPISSEDFTCSGFLMQAQLSNPAVIQRGG